jgi:tRNA threonylcarbamoyladenosine biosynthesis protein TsaE
MAEAAGEERQWALPDEQATQALALQMAGVLDDGMVIYLFGPLGAGKTSFARCWRGWASASASRVRPIA